MKDTFEHPPAKPHFEPLLPYDTLPNITDPEWNNTCEPLILHRVGDQGQHLLFAAVRHESVIENNPHYLAVKHAMQQFLELTQGRQRAVVVEGGSRTPAATAEESYRLGGEGGLAAFYAKQVGMQQYCFEPVKEGGDYLLAQGFTPEEIAVFLFARIVPSWDRRFGPRSSNPQDFEERMQIQLSGKGSIASSLRHLGLSYGQLKGMYEDMYGLPFTPEDPATVQFLLEETVGYMLPPRSRIHQIAIAVNRLRDEELRAGLYALWQDGISTFVPFGHTHGLTLQPFLESLGEEFA